MLTSIILVITALTLSRPAGAQAGAPLFVPDQEACFGRVYDRAHLAAPPNQTVTSLHIFRYLGERPEAENWQASQRDEAIKQFRETGYAAVQAFVTFRNRTGYFHNWLGCAKEAKEGTHCSVECDGGSCGEDEVDFSPGRDDKVFRLVAKAAAICKMYGTASIEGGVVCFYENILCR